jgi:hypothetical protein
MPSGFRRFHPLRQIWNWMDSVGAQRIEQPQKQYCARTDRTQQLDMLAGRSRPVKLGLLHEKILVSIPPENFNRIGSRVVGNGSKHSVRLQLSERAQVNRQWSPP